MVINTIATGKKKTYYHLLYKQELNSITKI